MVWDSLTEEEYEEMLDRCQEGKQCEYGICDECPLTIKYDEKE